MSDRTIIYFLSACLLLFAGVILYQQIVLRRGMQKKLGQISQKLKEIMDKDSDEKLMIFTDNQGIMELAAQINRLLESRQKVKADFRRAELSSKRMLSNISHDIKTPMTVVLGYMEILRLKDSEAGEMLERAEKKARSVMELINQFFTLAKLEAGDMDLTISVVDAGEICRETVLDFYEILVQKEFQVEINIPGEPVPVLGNKDAMQRILFNLISNAVRYGADGKYLELDLRADEDFVFIDVADRGKGIDPAFAHTVFDRLFTMDDSRNREIEGSGLGLTIARNLAQQLGGELTLKSEAFVSTVFTVRLRCAGGMSRECGDDSGRA